MNELKPEDIVRCQDCRLCEEWEGLIGGTVLYCNHWGRDTEEDAFCSYGERSRVEWK